MRFAAWLALAALGAAQDAKPGGSKLYPPPAGHLYHGVYPGGKSGAEDDLTEKDLEAYQKASGRAAAWVYFSHNWFRNRAFPAATAEWIRSKGAVPFIRLMMRSDAKEDHEEELFTLDAILEGQFDADLKKWGEQARAFETPLLVEWGTECNGDWFPWNGKWNGEDKKKKCGELGRLDGPGRFAAAYRRIVEKIRSGGAKNIQWVFHVNSSDSPREEWNRFEQYYPGDELVDFLAVSVYGPKSPEDDEAVDFAKQMDKAYSRLTRMASGKPILIAEFGCAAGHSKIKAERWAADALEGLLGGRWPQVAGFSWWNERWENGRRKADTTMRLQDTPALAETFQKKLSDAQARVETRPILAPPR